MTPKKAKKENINGRKDRKNITKVKAKEKCIKNSNNSKKS